MHLQPFLHGLSPPNAKRWQHSFPLCVHFATSKPMVSVQTVLWFCSTKLQALCANTFLLLSKRSPIPLKHPAHYILNFGTILFCLSNSDSKYCRLPDCGLHEQRCFAECISDVIHKTSSHDVRLRLAVNIRWQAKRKLKLSPETYAMTHCLSECYSSGWLAPSDICSRSPSIDHLILLIPPLKCCERNSKVAHQRAPSSRHFH